MNLSLDDPAGTVEGDAAGAVDLTYLRIIDALREAVMGEGAPVSYVNA